jgi:ATP-dependent DNA helicase RecG
LAVHDVGRYEIREILADGKPVVALTVFRREEGFSQTSDGRILVRRGGRNHALIGPSAWEFLSRRSLRRFEHADSSVPLSDALEERLREVADVYKWPHDYDGLLERLCERGLVIGTNLTIAGALFLTNPNTSMSLTKIGIEVRRYPVEGGEYDRRVVFDGPLQDQVRSATKFIVDELGSDLIVAGVYRYDLPRLPEVVVRETLANAVAHRTYENNRTMILAELRPDRVVVTSPGLLPEPVTVRTIRQAQAARNPDIIAVLRFFSLAEDAGRGVDVIEDTMQAALLDPPTFEEAAGSVRVTLPLRGPITPRERGWIADLQRRGRIEGSDRLLLVHAARGERLTNALTRAILNVDSVAARQALQRLRDARLLKQFGERRATSYVLVESIAPPAAYRMTPREIEDLVVKRAHDAPISNEAVRELTGLTREQALGLLRHLVARGRLVVHGSRRGTRYAVPTDAPRERTSPPT